MSIDWGYLSNYRFFVTCVQIHIMKYSLITLLLLFNFTFSKAQKKDSVPKHILYTISTDLAQYALSQPNIDFEYTTSSSICAGINFGYIMPSLLFKINTLANGQFTEPGTVYSGIAIRLYLKFYGLRHFQNYWCIQGVYKSISFNNVSFEDTYGDAYWNNYTMSEQTSVVGIEILNGHESTTKNRVLNLDLFYGLGFHFRIRNYTITNATLSDPHIPGLYPNKPIAYNGTYSGTLFLLTPVLGIKIGFNHLKKE